MISRIEAVARRTLLTLLTLTVVLAAGCGYSQEEWDAQVDKYNMLVAQHQRAETGMHQLQNELKAAQERNKRLEQDLTSMGVDVGQLNQDLANRNTELSSLSTTLEEREKALAEYKQRAAQLERIKQRFEKLKSKLEQLTSVGLKVSIRNNRMLISLPGDVLFASGSDRLREEGEDVLDKVAGVIGADPSLKARQYQVAGHTDNQRLDGGRFLDNWGLSVMRARSVLVYLIDPKKGKLPAKNWSAAGFSDTDPVATNDTKEGRQANRRCELVVVPSAEEMLDLKAIAQ